MTLFGLRFGVSGVGLPCPAGAPPSVPATNSSSAQSMTIEVMPQREGPESQRRPQAFIPSLPTVLSNVAHGNSKKFP